MLFFPAKPNSLPGGYRSDIDGLRAFAVLAVIFYHFDIGLFKGGFIGVDIFFVISGYLITKGIISLRENNKFDVGNFYARRARRLFPALIATIAATYAMAFSFFSPADFQAMSGSTVYALAGISNIYFWMGSGYFDTFSTLKPLLHTWSLSVELQFYLVWPFVLLALFHFGRKVCACGVVAFTVIAAAISIYYVKIDSSSAFFLTQFRMQEFAIGAIIVFAERLSISKAIKTVLYAAGLLMIAIPVFTYDVSKIAFPGYLALIPCAGAALMILAGDGISLSRMLSNRPVSHVGEISYSLYLTHWPVYVFTSYFFVGNISNLVILLMILVTFALSLLMYKFIERPFRNPKESKLSGAGFALVCSALAMAIIIPASSSWANKGWEWRVPKAVRAINSLSVADTHDFTFKAISPLTLKTGFDPEHKKPRLLIIGDSQSADIVNMLSESGNLDKYDAVARTVPIECGTPYIDQADQERYFTKEDKYTIARPEMIEQCKGYMANSMNPELLKSADKIYIALFTEPHSEPYLKKAIERMRTMTNAEMYLFGRKNITKNSVELVNALGRTIGVERFASEFKDQESYDINAKLSKYDGVTFIDMMQIVCPGKHECLVLTDKNMPIFFDRAHITKYGAEYLGVRLMKVLK